MFFIILILPILEILAQDAPLIGIKEEPAEFVGVGLRSDAQSPQIEKRRVSKTSEESRPADARSDYCEEHSDQYRNYCANFWADRPQRVQDVLFTFCPAYENKCLRRL
ncbi:unnamed protein product [Caenorhabditis bovis]|uniref:Uncharacterized protein n=1 Tax=Caenorhabditis bovis TaxID=2654633 RepID=A0A8S1EFL1_9PELO|nr:unnamed protein product [Caenorhabditis bovis]